MHSQMSLASTATRLSTFDGLGFTPVHSMTETFVEMTPAQRIRMSFREWTGSVLALPHRFGTSWRPILEIVVFVGLILALYFISTKNYLLYHCIAELFSIVIGYCILLIMIHTRHITKNNFYLGFGSIYGFLSTFDFVHMLAFRGMNMIVISPDPATQLWISSRFMESVACLAVLFLNKQVRTKKWPVYVIIFLQTLYLVICFLCIFYWKSYPVCFGPLGLTDFKKNSEYAICVLRLLMAIQLIWDAHTESPFLRALFKLIPFCPQRRSDPNRPGGQGLLPGIPWCVRSNLLMSVVFSIIAEVFFAFYISVSDWWNVLGHSFKAMSFYFIYKGLLEASLTQPYTSLFDDLVRTNQDLLMAKQRAEAAAKERSDVMAWMSHEIRTPLNGIVGMIDMLRGTELCAEQRKFVDVMEGASSGMMVVINDILDFFKLEAGKLVLETLPTNLLDLANSVVMLFGQKMADRKISSSVIVRGNLPPSMECDPTRIRQVLSNLVSNSVKFTYDGAVTVIISEDGEQSSSDGVHRVRFEVRDTGVGIEQAQLGNLFKPFSQLHASTARLYGGTGLGLNIVRQLVELMDGTITVTSQVGVGSQFTFVIPMKAHLKDNVTEEKNPNAIAMISPTLATLRILAVDDNEINRAVLGSFAKRIGCAMDFACNGKEAVDYAAAAMLPGTSSFGSACDIVFMDVSMPVMNGLEATSKLRQMGVEVPIIGLTADITKETYNAGLISEMNDVLLKPLKYQQFVECLHKWTNPAGNASLVTSPVHPQNHSHSYAVSSGVGGGGGGTGSPSKPLVIPGQISSLLVDEDTSHLETPPSGSATLHPSSAVGSGVAGSFGGMVMTSMAPLTPTPGGSSSEQLRSLA